ncbi:MAG TPA: HAD-IIIC family phosphatase [Candidatus Dormibacteraeota bacterium]|nr:HAD-IIIC family phosphatase [Candidatus Dormibacteraeota bacterium]
MDALELTRRGDELAKAGQHAAALDLYVRAAKAVETPAGELCLKIARAAQRVGKRTEAFAWLARVADVSRSFLDWSGAAALLTKLEVSGRPSARRSTRVALIGSYTTAQLGSMLRVAGLAEGIDIVLFEGGYGQYRQEIIDPDSAIYRFAPDFVVIAVHHGALELPTLSESPEEVLAAETARWQRLWQVLAERSGARVIQHNFAIPPEVPLGHLAARVSGSRYAMMQELNIRLGAAASDAVLIVDCERLASTFGKGAWFDSRYWNAAKQAVALDALPMLARHTVSVMAAALGLNRKCLVLDLDNTLWGGVVGEDGLSGIALGQGTPAAEAFVAFQDYILQLNEKGIILAVASKNNEADARAVFEHHPEMRIRLADLAAFFCNWDDKATNLRRIAEQLNLGLDALTVADDNPAERALVRAMLPEVDVIPLPEDPSGYVRALSDYLRFETAALTTEDRTRTQQYRMRSAASALAASAEGIEDFYRSLEMEARIAPFDEFHLPRIAQLINKTNQFNLTTRRYTPEELRALMRDPTVIHRYLKLRDRFGDHGLVSVLIARRAGTNLDIETWLMSCRVISRTVDAEMLAHLSELARQKGVDTIRGTYIPSARNAIVSEIYGKYGFVRVGSHDGATSWEYDLAGQGPIRNGFIANWSESDDAA